MLFDENGVMSEFQAITASAESTNKIDFGENGTPIGWAGKVFGDLGNSGIKLLVQVTEAFNNLTSLKVSVQMDDNEAFASPTTIASSEAVPLATLKPGYHFKVPDAIPEGATERYYRLYYTVAGTAPTTGKVFGGIVAGRPAR